MNPQTHRNVDVLKRLFPAIFEKVADVPIPPSHRLVPTPAGVPTLRVSTPGGREIHLHSPVDPRREGERIAAALPGEHRLLVVLGCGLFYHVLAALPALPAAEPVLLVEADPAVLCMALSCTALGGLFERPGVALFVGDAPEAIADYLDRHHPAEILSKLAVLRHLPAGELSPDYYGAVYREVIRRRDYADCRMRDPELASFINGCFPSAAVVFDELLARLPRGAGLGEAREVLQLMDALRQDGD